MSLRYRDKNGAEAILAGLTPGGDIEYGAVATREGILNIPVVSSSGYITSVTFAEPMPDADYEISLCDDETSISGKTMLFNLFNKTANGFSILCHRLNLGDSVAFKLHWTAFKLYTVADAEQLYSDVTDIKVMIPSSASSTNKFATADDLRTESRALDRRLDDVEDVIPTGASVSNQLATKADVDNATIDELGDIGDVDVSTVTDGQTIIWDDTNSKWVNGQGGKIYTAGDGINISNTDEISAKIDDTSITTDDNDALKVADTYKTTFIGTRQEWEALTAADKKKYKIANITDDAPEGNPEIYSTEETKTNKFWIDGKPIYRKVYTDVSMVSGTSLFSDIDIEEMIDIYGYIYYNNYRYPFPISAASYYGAVEHENSNAWHIISSGLNAYKANIIVEYTKAD